MEQLRKRVRAMESNVSAAEARMVKIISNTSASRSIIDAKYADVAMNYQKVNNASLRVSESKAEMKSDAQSAKDTSVIAAQVQTASEILKAKAERGAMPENVTRVDALEQTMWNATDSKNPASVNAFSQELKKTEDALRTFEKNLTDSVQKVLRNASFSFPRQVKKLRKGIKHMDELYRSLIANDA